MADLVVRTRQGEVLHSCPDAFFIWRTQSSAPERLFGTPFPREPNRADGTDPRIFWLGPDRWGLSGTMRFAEISAALSLPGVLSHLADLTDGICAFRCMGADAAALIARGCSLDLHPRPFRAGQCAQSLLAQVHVLIDRIEDGFTVYADRSYERYLTDWFRHAARHSGLCDG